MENPVDLTHHIHMFRSAPAHLFRGARLDGDYESPYSRYTETPTSIDPIVATLYAAHQRSKGKAKILILEKEKFKDKIGGPSYRSYASIELAVNLALTPMEVEKMATKILHIEESIDILNHMGFPLPQMIYNPIQLENELRDSTRLFPKQIEEYSHLALRDKP